MSSNVFALTLLLVCLSIPASAQEFLEPFRQEFKMTLGGFKVSSVRTLSQLEDGNYELQLRAKNMIARYEEKSIFILDDNDQILPLQHSVSSKVFGISRHQKTLFDWDEKKATYTKKDTTRTVDIETGLLDRALYQLLIPRDLTAGITEPSYDFVDRGRIKNYTFGVLDEEQVDLADDRVLAVKLKRIQEDADKETLIWFAPEHGYELVKIAHTEEGGSDYHMVLKGELEDQK